MGQSVYSEVDPKQYFSISTVKRSTMDKYGISCTIKELREKARNSVPKTEILTGNMKNPGKCRLTKIYAYADFIEEGNGKSNATGNA